MKSRLRNTLLVLMLIWLALTAITACVAPAAQRSAEPIAVATATPMSDSESVYIVAILAPELLSTTVPFLLSTPTTGQTPLFEAPDTSLALMDVLTWSLYRPIPNSLTSSEDAIPGLDVTAFDSTTHITLPLGIDSGKLSNSLQNHILSRLADLRREPSIVRPTPCPGPTPGGPFNMTIEHLSQDSLYSLPLLLDYDEIQKAFYSRADVTDRRLLEVAGPYIATGIDSTQITLERNPFYGQNLEKSRIDFVVVDDKSVLQMDPPPNFIYDPNQQMPQPSGNNPLDPEVIQSGQELWRMYLEICPECAPPSPSPAPPCKVDAP